VTFVDNEHPVGALAADGAHPSLRERVGPCSQLHRIRMIGSDVSG
jgi:hypothetical protein